MPFYSLALIALGVSADAFAVALGKGLGIKRLRLSSALAIALTFGVFQAVMPFIGWLLGSAFADLISAFDHWIAFCLLLVVGGKMLWEAFRGGEGDVSDGLRVRELLVLGFATSIDALAVGIGFAFLDIDILPTVLLIGGATTLLSLGGVYLGHRVGTRFSKPAEIIGGLVLIGIGVSVLVEHLTAG